MAVGTSSFCLVGLSGSQKFDSLFVGFRVAEPTGLVVFEMASPNSKISLRVVASLQHWLPHRPLCGAVRCETRLPWSWKAAAILAARKLAQCDGGRRVPATISAI